MENTPASPQTLLETIRYFSNPDTCLKFMAELRWPDGPICPRCQALDPIFISTRRLWKCRGCKKQFTIKLGTIMEDSALPLDKWLAAIWLIANAKNGISSYEIHRALGITQKSAWFLLHRVRLAMKTGTFEKLQGTVEADETFVGGQLKNLHKKKRAKLGKLTGGRGKTIVMGLLERGTKRITAKVIPEINNTTLHGEIRAHVEPGSEIFTDSNRAYLGLEPDYLHESINHLDEY
jgi:transposase-like protein